MLSSCHWITNIFRLHVQAQQLPLSSMQACILTVAMHPAFLQALICDTFCRAITRQSNIVSVCCFCKLCDSELRDDFTLQAPFQHSSIPGKSKVYIETYGCQVLWLAKCSLLT